MSATPETGAVQGRPPAAAARRPLVERLPAWLFTPEVAAAAIAACFIAISAWWLASDSRLPNGDAGRHMVLVKVFLDALGRGELLVPLRDTLMIDNEFYPPLGHLVGVLGAAVGGYGVTAITLADNLVFVPLLALGCFGAGSVAFDRRAGALAVLFILGCPILISQFHVFMLDAPLTAAAAVAIWLLLLSDRFGRVEVSALAGIAVGLGTMIKVTFPLFVGGMVLVMLARGGWRNWRGAAVFGLVVVLITQPWLLFHLNELRDRGDLAAAGPDNPRVTGPLGNYGAYFFNFVGTQALLPLAAFTFTGIFVGLRSWWRDKNPAYTPELLGGLALGILGPASMNWFNERYTMPALVYAALLGTGWISRLPRPHRIAATVALAAIVVANTVMVNTGLGGPVLFETPLEQRDVVILSDAGYVENKPQRGPMLPLMRAASAEGIDRIAFEGPSLNEGGLNLNGLATYAYTAGLEVIPQWEAQNLGANGLYAFRLPVEAARREPCLELAEGYGLYFTRGGSPGPGISLYCPDL